MPVLPRKATAVIKFAAGILLLPLLYSFSVSFINEFNTVKGDLALYFWAGAVSFAIFFIFIYQPELIYNYGQQAVGAFFSFYKPLAGIASYLVPAYTLALFIIYWVLSVILGARGISGYFLLLIGFASALHLVFSAKSLNSGRGDFLKANYIFGFSLVYLVNLLLLGGALSLMLRGFSFAGFFT
ncbi:MAG: hypothetical protein QME65_03930, partial [Candidatus Omnitrophota bacterium]|nr:hypothetical protein [Candidatus Omnitrophota bacterium]